jgi:hypothetical protein
LSQPYGYYYGNEADQYTFYRLPKALFTNNRYKNLSDGAKILYGLMLDRMGLSVKNGWLDERNRVFIYFTLEDVQEYMNCHRDKGMKLLAELDTIKGVGLIERVKRGLGKPSVIYVLKFFDDTDLQRSEKPTSGLHDLPTSGGRNNRSQDVDKTDPNNNYINNTDSNDIDSDSFPFLPQTPSLHEIQETAKPRTEEDGKESASMSTVDKYRELIKENIEYPYILARYPYHTDRIDEIVDLMLETVCSARKVIRVAGDDYPAELVKSKFLKLNGSHIEFVMDCLKNNTTEIRNIKKYMLAVLFNAPTTMGNYYSALVAHDMANGLL